MKTWKKLETYIRDKNLLVVEVMSRFSQGQGIIYSAYLAFYLLLSIFPFIMALVGIMGFIPFEVDEALNRLIDIFPMEIHGGLRSFIEVNRRSSNLLGYSLFFLLWSSARAIGAIRKSLDRIYDARNRQNFIKARFFDSIKNFAFIFLLLLVLFFPTAVKLTKIGTVFLKFNIPYVLTLVESLQWVFIFTLLFGVLSFVYMRMGSLKQRFDDVKVGALLVALAWVILSFLFNGIISLSSNLIYGAFNVVIGLLIWFQINMVVSILGAHLNVVLSERRFPYD